jgi:hypothetical protein
MTGKLLTDFDRHSSIRHEARERVAEAVNESVLTDLGLMSVPCTIARQQIVRSAARRI